MIGAVRTYSTIITKKGTKPLRRKYIKKPKSGINTLPPVFQYPVSQPEERRIYVWGLADHGGLGTLGKVRKSSDGFNYIAKPSRLWFGENHKIVDIACGYGFTVFGVNGDDSKNIIYGNGINSDSQIGFNDDDLKHHKHDIISVPRPISLPLKKKGTKVIGLAAGRAHLLILTTEGLFTLGNNSYGQCGRPIISHENYNRSSIIHHIPNIKGTKITAVTAGQDHSIIVNENGEVYAFGWGADGQTGLAHYRIEYQPSLVKGDIAGEKIIKVACTSDCVLALSEKGKVYGWGNSEYGQLPIKGHNHQVNVAVEIEDCSKLGHIIDIASGGSSCMILSSKGDIYVWGYGILGFGPQLMKVTIPTRIPNALFGKNPYQQDVKIVQIYCGINQMAAVTNAGDLYTWGVNKFGNLGIGSCLDQFFPFKVAVGSQVQKFACGPDHTVTLCKPFI